MEVSNFYLFTTIVVGLLFPIYIVWDGTKTKKFLLENPEKLIPVFQQVILTQLALATLVFLSFYFSGDSLGLIGLSFLTNSLAIIALLVLPFLFLWLINAKQLSESEVEKIKKGYEDIMYLMPKNRKEFQWSILLSFVAGIFEEILYRGFLFWQLSLYMHWIVALLLTNIIFGILHLGTGTKNALATFGLGMIYSALSIPFDTLWLAILAHILTDVYAMGIGFKTQ